MSALLGRFGVGRMMSLSGPPMMTMLLLLQIMLRGTLRGMVLTGVGLLGANLTRLRFASPQSPPGVPLPMRICLLLMVPVVVEWARLLTVWVR